MKAPSNKIKIVIADDSPEFIEGLKVLFSTSPKYEILDVASNGLELLESSHLYEADLALIDIEMPIMNGFEVAKRIGFKYSSIMLIAITMYLDKAYLRDIIEAGFKAFIHKPLVSDQLFEVIDQVLSNNYVFPGNLRIELNN